MTAIDAEIVRCDAVAPAPWRNGGGVTRELMAWPSAAAWQVRISVADVDADGPFSSFPGVQRWFAVLDGAGVDLTIDGTTRRCTATSGPVPFDGDAATTCRLVDGPTRDLNLMLRHADGAMQAAVPGTSWRPQASHAGLYAVAAGRCTADGESIDLAAHSLLWLTSAPVAMTFVADAAAPVVGWWISATPRPEGA